MTAAMHSTPDGSVSPLDVSHVFATTDGVDGRAVRLANLVDPAFLTEAGWDPATSVLSPPPAHPLLGRPVCRVARCSTTAPARSRLCAACRRRLDHHALADDEIDLLPALTGWAKCPGLCAVTECRREWVSSRRGLCRAHLDQADTLGIGVAEFCGHPAAQPHAGCDRVRLLPVCSSGVIGAGSTARPINSDSVTPAARIATSTSSGGGCPRHRSGGAGRSACGGLHRS